MPKVLMISYLFPPIANSGTQRSVKFANHLFDFGWEPTVLTVEPSEDMAIEPSLLEEVDPRVDIVKAPYWSREASRVVAKRFPKHKEKIESALDWRIKALWSIPDPYYFWKRSAVKKGQDVYKKQGFDLIYASGTPWTSFLVARELSRKTGVPYILDYRDLWNNIDEAWAEDSGIKASIRNKISCRQELSVMKNAAAIVSVTNSCVERLKETTTKATANTRFKCITNGFEPAEFDKVSAEPENSKVFKIGYTGVWKKGYGPSSLYQAVKALTQERPDLNIEIHAAGFSADMSSDYGLSSSIVKEYGKVAHKRAIQIMKSCDLLFLPVAQGSYSYISLPGKFFEFIGSNKPILAEVPKGSEVQLELSHAGGGLCVDVGDIESIKAIVEDVLKGNMEQFPHRNEDYILRYHRKHQAGQLARLFNDLMEEC